MKSSKRCKGRFVVFILLFLIQLSSFITKSQYVFESHRTFGDFNSLKGSTFQIIPAHDLFDGNGFAPAGSYVFQSFLRQVDIFEVFNVFGYCGPGTKTATVFTHAVPLKIVQGIEVTFKPLEDITRRCRAKAGDIFCVVL